MGRENRNRVSRARILDVAEGLFAFKGYDAVTVREITKGARCNLAAVNYHFGNKRNLYLEVFRSRWLPRAGRIRRQVKEALRGQTSPSPRAAIRALAEAYIEGPLSDAEQQRHSQLMAREMVRPTEAFDLVVREVMGPLFRDLQELLSPAMKDHPSHEALMLRIHSILAMVIHFNFARVAVSRMSGREYDAAFKKQLVAHITEFSLRGLGIEE